MSAALSQPLQEISADLHEEKRPPCPWGILSLRGLCQVPSVEFPVWPCGFHSAPQGLNLIVMKPAPLEATGCVSYHKISKIWGYLFLRGGFYVTYASSNSIRN